MIRQQIHTCRYTERTSEPRCLANSFMRLRGKYHCCHTRRVVIVNQGSGQHGFWSSITAAAIVAVFALLFAALTFWWQNLRRGRLQTWEPHSFAARLSTHAAQYRIPLVLYNSGAVPILVQDLRMSFPGEPDSVLPLPWASSWPELSPGALAANSKLPAGFAVAGREVEQVHMEFGGPFPGFVPEARDYTVLIEVLLGHKKGWQPLIEFQLRAGRIRTPHQFIAYSNSPQSPTDADRAKADAALKKLLEVLNNEKEERGPS